MVALMAALTVSLTGEARGAALLQDLENALMCKCDDKCGKVLINCTCDTSKKTRKDLVMKLESGLTVEQVIQGYVEKYGETILSAPTKNGFNLTAWITPFAAIVVGGFGVRKVIRSWTRKGDHDLESSAEESLPQQSGLSENSSRLKDELDKLET